MCASSESTSEPLVSSCNAVGVQEVSVGGQDIVFKDIIEPLESVSVSITPSDKDDITLYGDANEVLHSQCQWTQIHFQ